LIFMIHKSGLIIKLKWGLIFILFISFLSLLLLLSYFYLRDVSYISLQKDILEIELTNGLGNNLFQIASAYGISKQTNRQLIVSYSTLSNPIDHEIFSYSNDSETMSIKKYITRKIKNIPWVSSPTFTYPQPDNQYTYTDLPSLQGHSHVLLRGYFQSEKYFFQYRETIIEWFTPMISLSLTYMIQTYHPTHHAFIHVRRIDKKEKEFTDLWLKDYYSKAIKKFSLKTNFLVFSNDLNWCKEQNIFLDLKNRIVFVENNLLNSFELIYFMSLSLLGGIVGHSSYSWWACWLNQNPNKICIFPSPWFHSSQPPSVSWNDIYFKDSIVL